MVAFATLSIPFFLWALQTEKKLLSRVVAAGQVVSILLAWFWVQMPVVIRLAEPAPDLTFYNSVAPDATLRQLFLALVVGSCIILPSLYYLVKVFKGERFSSEK